MVGCHPDPSLKILLNNFALKYMESLLGIFNKEFKFAFSKAVHGLARKSILEADNPAWAYVSNCGTNAAIVSWLLGNGDYDDKVDGYLKNRNVYHVRYCLNSGAGHAYVYVVIDDNVLLFEAQECVHALRVSKVSKTDIIEKMLKFRTKPNKYFLVGQSVLANESKILENAIRIHKAFEKKPELVDLEIRVKEW